MAIRPLEKSNSSNQGWETVQPPLSFLLFCRHYSSAITTHRTCSAHTSPSLVFLTHSLLVNYSAIVQPICCTSLCSSSSCYPRPLPSSLSPAQKASVATQSAAAKAPSTSSPTSPTAVPDPCATPSQNQTASLSSPSAAPSKSKIASSYKNASPFSVRPRPAMASPYTAMAGVFPTPMTRLYGIFESAWARAGQVEKMRLRLRKGGI